MSNTRGILTKQHRYAPLLFIVLLGVFLISCSGGGDSGGVAPNDDSSESDLLPLYDLVIAGVGDGITAVVNESDATHTIRINPTLTEGAGLAATLNCDVNTENCEIGSIKTDTKIEVYDLGETLFGNFVIRVMETLSLLGSENPTTGLIQITAGADIIELNITTCNTAPGVNILLNDTALGCYPWPDFENLDEIPEAAPAEKIAVFAFDMIDFIFYQANFANNSFDSIGDSIREAGGSKDFNCDAFNNRGLSVQPGIPNQGIFNFSWVDDNSNNIVGSGDRFQLNFTECWLGDLDDIDLYNGAIDLNDYTIMMNSQGVITRMGFEGGGVIYNGFEMTEAFVDGNNVFPNNTTISLSGGFTIVYSEPVQ